MKNKEIATRFYLEVLKAGNLTMLEELMAPDFIDHNAPPGQVQGIEGFRQFLKMVTTAFPDINLVLEDMLAEGDKIAVRVTISGTQSGILMGTIPPSKRKATWSGIDILEIKGGKIVGRWSERNLLSVMRQIGAIEM